jgi:hypothetical protein
MYFFLYVFIGSGVLLLLFSFFLKAESIRGQRLILVSGRNQFDYYLIKLISASSQAFNFISGKVIRLTLHFLIHQVLAFMLQTLRFLESHISRLQWRNRILARRVRLAEVKSHLELIAEHQEENALTEKEKQKLKEKSISG